MINFTNKKRYNNVPFDEYLKVGGYSYSFLKREQQGSVAPFISTKKVELGKLVDAILTQPDDIDIYSPLLKIAEQISNCLLDNFGDSIKHFESQVSLTCDMEYSGLKMPFRGRLDWGLKDVAVIDLKVTAEKNLRNVINHMGYDNQLFGYCGAYSVKLGYILIYSSTTNKYDLIQMPLNGEQFWKEKILKFGSVNIKPNENEILPNKQRD